MRAVISLIQALLFIVSSFSVQDSNFKFWVDRAAYKIGATSDISFESMGAKEYAVLKEEQQKCRNWFSANILTKENSAYNFTVGGKSLRNNIDDWEITIGKESEVDTIYEIYNYDTPDIKAKRSVEQLMNGGIELTIDETPKAVIMIYSIAE